MTNRLDPSSIFCTSGRMDLETLLARPLRIDATHAAYSVQAKHSQMGDVARAADLIEGGYGAWRFGLPHH